MIYYPETLKEVNDIEHSQGDVFYFDEKDYSTEGTAPDYTRITTQCNGVAFVGRNTRLHTNGVAGILNQHYGTVIQGFDLGGGEHGVYIPAGSVEVDLCQFSNSRTGVMSWGGNSDSRVERSVFDDVQAGVAIYALNNGPEISSRWTVRQLHIKNVVKRTSWDSFGIGGQNVCDSVIEDIVIDSAPDNTVEFWVASRMDRNTLRGIRATAGLYGISFGAGLDPKCSDNLICDNVLRADGVGIRAHSGDRGNRVMNNDIDAPIQFHATTGGYNEN